MRTLRWIADLRRAATVACLLPAIADAQQTTRVSVSSSGVEGNGYSFHPTTTADGQLVAFWSDASNLVAGDTNFTLDVFVHDRATGITERVSVDSAGAEGNDFSSVASIAAGGRFVAFQSNASNLVAGDTNAAGDVFVHDRSTGTTERISVDSAGAEGDGPSGGPSISADGKLVAFSSWASNLVAGDTNAAADVFVHDRSTGITERISVASSGMEGDGECRNPAISADGRYVAFASFASNLVAGDTNATLDVFVHDRSTGRTARISVDSSGAQANDYSDRPAIATDGRIVAYFSWASNLVAGDANGRPDVFVHDAATGLTERISVDSSGAEGNDSSYDPSIAADGQIVAFWSWASNLVADDANAIWDVFVRDRASGRTERVSVDSSGAEAHGPSAGASISADGVIVAFDSFAADLVAGDTNVTGDVFVHERCVVDAAWSSYGAGWPGTLGIPSLVASADPVVGTTISLDVSNSFPLWNVGFLFAGWSEQSRPLKNSGTLLVDDLLLFLPLAIAPYGSSFPTDIPHDHQLCGVPVFLQVLELDDGASKGLSFTPGLELVIGH